MKLLLVMSTNGKLARKMVTVSAYTVPLTLVPLTLTILEPKERATLKYQPVGAAVGPVDPPDALGVGTGQHVVGSAAAHKALDVGDAAGARGLMLLEVHRHRLRGGVTGVLQRVLAVLRRLGRGQHPAAIPTAGALDLQPGD